MKRYSILLILFLVITTLFSEVIFFDDFETNTGWTLTGEFEIGTPNGLGGDHGNPDPVTAFEGSNILGADLSGYGDYPGDYEPNLSENAYKAVSPVIDCSQFVDINLSFKKWLGIEQPTYDHAKILISGDNGGTWTTLWENDQTISDNSWHDGNFDISDYADLKSQVKIAFTIGPTDGSWQYCGWNIDNFTITGTHIQYGNIEGFVNDSQNFQPISNAMVSTNYGIAYTDSIGYYFIQNLPALSINFTVSAPGYQTLHEQNIQIPANDTLSHNFQLIPQENIPPSPNNLVAEVNYNSVLLSWQPPQESEHFFIAYNVFRNNVLIFSTTDTNYVDNNLVIGEYTYYITAYYDTGSSLPSNSVTVQVVTDNSQNNEINQCKYNLTNYPNPFNPTTTISFNLPNTVNSPIIEIYNLKGQKVKTFQTYSKKSGNMKVVWDGTNQNGEKVSGGVYFYKLKVSDKVITKKMILLK